jgi:membrane-bound lytic murein transglycosylase D
MKKLVIFVTVCLIISLPKASYIWASELNSGICELVKEFINEETRVAQTFPKPKEIERSANFWIKLFSEYSSNQIVIHDSYYQDIIYAVIDTEKEDAQKKKRLSNKEAHQISQTEQRIIKDLKALHKLDMRGEIIPADLTPDQLNIFNLFSSINEKDRFKKAANTSRVRLDRGLKDNFAEALYRSGYYAETMTAILDSVGVPNELIALVFPESMFKASAYSTAKAAGFWQFIPEAADDDTLAYLKINEIVDERKDPEKSTLAAARKLQKECNDYCLTVSNPKMKIEDVEESLWPHACIGYIFGPDNVQDIMKAKKTSDLVALIQAKWPRKKFYTNNYYPEFLAASYVYRYRNYFFPDVEPAPSWEETTAKMELPKDARFQKIAETVGISTDSLSFLNPQYTRRTVAGEYKIKKGSKIRIPVGSEQAFAQLENLPVEKSRSIDDAWTGKVVEYVIREGDTLSELALKVGVTVDTLRTINRLNDYTIIAGEKIYLPAHN